MAGSGDSEVKVRFVADTSDLQDATDRVQRSTTAATAAVQQSTTAAGSAATAQSSLATAMRQADAAGQRAAAGTRSLDDELAQLLSHLDPVYAATKRLSDGEDALDQGLASGLITTEQHASALAALEQRLKKAKDAADEAASGNKGLGLSTTQAVNGVRALTDELASGRTRQAGGTFTRLAIEIAQVHPAAVLGGIGILALTAALVAAVVHVEEFDRAIGEIDAALTATGRSADVNRASLERLVQQLRTLPGVTTASAEEMVEALARQRSIGVSSYEALGEAAAGYARVEGTEAPAALKTLVSALDGGYEAIRRLDQAYGFLSPDQLESIRQWEEQGEQGRALDVVIPALRDHFSELATQGLTPVQTSTHDLRTAWDELLASLSNTAPFAAARGGLAMLFEGLAIDLQPAASSQDGLSELETKLKTLQKRKTSVEQTGIDPSASVSETESETWGQGLTSEQDLEDINREIDHVQALIAAKKQAAQTSTTSPNGAPDQTSDTYKRADALTLTGLAAQREKIEAEILQLRQAQALAAQQGDTGRAAKYGDRIGELQTQEAGLKPAGGTSQIQAWRDQLDQQLLAERKFGKDALAVEQEFWQQKLALTKDGTAEQAEARRELLTVDRQIATEGASAARKATSEQTSDQLDALKRQISAEQTTTTEKEALLQQYTALAAASYRQGSAQYEAAKNYEAEVARKVEAEKNAAVLESHNTQRQIEQIKLEETKSDLDQEVAEGRITNVQKVELARQAAQEEYRLQLQGLQDELALMETSVAQRQKINDQILILQARHNAQMASLNKQSATAQKADLDKSTQEIERTFAPIERAFQGSIQGIIQGTTTWQQAAKNAAASVLASMIGAAAQSAFHWVAAEIAKTTATTTGNAVRAASDAGAHTGLLGDIGETLASWLGLETSKTASAVAGNAAQVALDADRGLSQISIAASVAAANAFAAAAGIPGVAEAAAEAAYAETSAFGLGITAALPSAAGGWERVPYDGALTELHRDEMVLPAYIASPLRAALGAAGTGYGVPALAAPMAAASAAASTAGAARSSAGGDTHHYALSYAPSISAIDRSGVKQMLDQHSSAFFTAFQRQAKNRRVKV